MNKAGKVVFRDTKEETRRGSSHIISKPSPVRIMKSECLKLDPEMAKETDLHSNFQGVIITPLVGLI